jgi:hypothetical protein
MNAPKPAGYFASARAPRYSILFALPLLVVYEVLAWTMGQGEVAAVRNGADVLLKSMFGLVGGEHGLTSAGTGCPAPGCSWG